VPSLLTNLSTNATTAAPARRPVHLALATSSHAGNFHLKTAHLPALFAAFPPARRVLGDDARVPKGRGKPLPDIYLLALDIINGELASARAAGATEEPAIRPEECLVFEDSVPGVEAGRRAGMQVVWCPHPGLRQEYAGREERVLAGLMGEAEVGSDERDGAPGTEGDGYGVFLESLEGFDYGRFGISLE
jgi:pseudouridine 5'-phosphatase